MRDGLVRCGGKIPCAVCWGGGCCSDDGKNKQDEEESDVVAAIVLVGHGKGVMLLHYIEMVW